MKKHSELSAVKSLSKKQDCQINGNEIQVLKGERAKNDLGNGSWGKIDFLVNFCGYRTIPVKRFI